MSDFENEIERLKQEIALLEGKKNQIPTYSFSKIGFDDLESLVDIRQNFNDIDIFKNWFNYNYNIPSSDIEFLENLIKKHIKVINIYFEEDLKVKFISPILNRVDFSMIDKNIRDFYNEKLIYKSEKFILSGETDFVVSKGIRKAREPYFFIQEFKKGFENSDPRPQLLAELISGLELNNQKFIKGAYIVGNIWNFVILEKLGDNKYQYFVSANFDSSKIDDLKSIYKNLMFIKNEVLEKLER